MTNSTSDESFFATLAQSMPIAISAVDLTGRIRFVNNAFCRLVGWSESDLIGQAPPYPHWPKEDATDLLNRMSRLMSGEFDDGGYLIRFQHRQGERFTVRVTVRALRDGANQVIGCMAAVEDMRKLSEVQDALREREHFIESVTHAVPEIIYVYDLRENRNVYANRHIATSLGYTPEQILEMGDHFLTSLVHPEDLQRLPNLFARWRKARDGQILETEYRIRHVSGDYRWFLGRDTVFQRDESGKVIQFIGAAQDITERKKAEATRDRALADLLEGERRYRLLADHSTDLIARLDTSGIIRYASPACERLLGYTPQELTGRSEYELVHANDRDTVFQFHAAIVRERESRTASYRIRRKDGDTIWCETHAQPIADPVSQDIVEILAVSRDITDRKRAEEALRKSEELFRALVERGNDGIAMIDANSHVRYLSPAAIAIIGYTLEEMFEIPAWTLVVPEDLAIWIRLAPEHLQRPNGSFRQRSRIRQRSGAIRHVEIVVTNHLEQPDIAAYVVNFHDVTECIDLEEQLRQAQKMEAVGQLAGGIAHDFNNILTAILGNVAQLAETPALPDPAQTTLMAIEGAAKRAAELTQRLLGFSRRTALHLQVLDINQIVKETLTMLRPTIDPRIAYECGLYPNLWSARADPAQISQVLINLLLNARDAMPQGGCIRIISENRVIGEEDCKQNVQVVPGGYVRIAVEDTGCGMTPAVQARLFEPFFTTKPTGQGTGLGLPMVYGIVKAHGGWVTCQSEVGVGTRMELFLPRSISPALSHSATPRTTPLVDAATSTGETILLVDDEPSIRTLGRHILEQHGYRVLLAEDGLDALETFREVGGKVALVILDLTMPRMSGQDTFRELRRIAPTLRVLFSSGYSVDQLGEVDDAVGFINKPYRPSELVAAVQAHLRHVDSAESPERA